MNAAARTDTAVAARDLSIRYRSDGVAPPYIAVRGVSFTIARGEFLGVLGESGAGKSTLARALAGQIGHSVQPEGGARICGGSLTVLGTSLRRVTRRKRDRLTINIGYLPQDAAERLTPWLTVAENVAEPIYSRDRHFSGREATGAVASVIDSMRLPLTLMQKLPYELSSGQRQRVALARALVLEPQLLIADEPARGVDTKARSGVFEALTRLRAERGMAALIVSSSLSDVRGVVSRLAVMQRGVIVGLGTVDEVLDRPHHPYLKALKVQQTLNSSQEVTLVD